MTFFSRSILISRVALFALVVAVAFGGRIHAAPMPDDPAASAVVYATQAEELRASAAKHAKMAKTYGPGNVSSKTGHANIALHCERIAKNLEEAATESEALAAAFRQLAK